MKQLPPGLLLLLLCVAIVTNTDAVPTDDDEETDGKYPPVGSRRATPAEKRDEDGSCFGTSNFKIRKLESPFKP
jgi:hypothetical protein